MNAAMMAVCPDEPTGLLMDADGSGLTRLDFSSYYWISARCSCYELFAQPGENIAGGSRSGGSERGCSDSGGTDTV